MNCQSPLGNTNRTQLLGALPCTLHFCYPGPSVPTMPLPPAFNLSPGESCLISALLHQFCCSLSPRSVWIKTILIHPGQSWSDCRCSIWLDISQNFRAPYTVITKTRGILQVPNQKEEVHTLPPEVRSSSQPLNTLADPLCQSVWAVRQTLSTSPVLGALYRGKTGTLHLRLPKVSAIQQLTACPRFPPPLIRKWGLLLSFGPEAPTCTVKSISNISNNCFLFCLEGLSSPSSSQPLCYEKPLFNQ